MSALKYYDTTTGTWKYLAQGVKGDKGEKGNAGNNGTNGAGVAVGGTDGQALVKIDSTDYNTQWTTLSTTPSGSASGDLTGTYPGPTLAAVGTAGTYTQVTTDSKGRVTAGSNVVSVKEKFLAALTNMVGPIKAIPTADTSLISSTSTSAISGATVYAYNSGKFTFRGLNATTYTNSSGTTYYRNNAGLTSTGDVIFNQFWVEFDYYGSNFDLRYNNNQSGSNSGYSQFWIWIDGVPTTSSAVLPAVSSDVDRFYQVVLPSTKQRRVRILLAGLDFGGIGVKDITETVFPVNQQLLKVAFIDASWFAGSNGGTNARNCANQLVVQLGEMLNVDYYNLSVPGTGYVNGNNTDPILGTVTNSGGNGENWCSPNRLSPLSTISPDLIIIQGTTNDDAYTGTSYQLSDHATYVYDQIKNTYAPNAKIIVFTRGNNGYTSSNSATNASTVYAAASAHSSVIGAVNIYGESWVAGFYNSGTSTWTTRGNGEVLINTSDLHPNADGNKYYASRIFDRTYDIIKNYTRS